MKHSYFNLKELERNLPVKVKVLDKIIYGLSFNSLFYFIISSLIVFIVSCLYVPWVQTVQGNGKVIAYLPDERQQTIDAPIEGRIQKWFVTEGQKVSKGQPIVELNDIDPEFITRLTTEKESILSKILAVEKSIQNSKNNLERQKNLEKKGLSSKRAVELADIEYSKFQSELANANAELVRLETKIKRQLNQTIVAPKDGTIMKILAPQGNVIVKTSDPLAILVPKSSRQAVELLVSGNDIPLISIGKKVRVQFEGWPAIQFSGWPSKAIGTFGGEVAFIDQGDDGTGKFRIIVFSDSTNDWPEEKYLKQGIRAIGWVLLDPVKLGWELWRQFNGFPPSIKSDQGKIK